MRVRAAPPGVGDSCARRCAIGDDMRDALSAVWSSPFVRVTVALAAVAAAVLAFRAVHPAGALFFGAFALAYVANPVVDALERRGAHRALGVALVVVGLIAAVVTATQLSVNAIRSTLTEDDDGVALTENARAWFLDLPDNLQRLLPEPALDVVAGPVATIGEALEQLGSMLAPHLEDVASALVGVVSGTVTGVFQTVVLLILTVYVLYDFHRITAAMLALVPKPYHDGVRALAGSLDDAVGSFVRGQLVIAVLVGLMVYLGLSLIGLPLAGFIALLAGLLNVVPFLGSIVPAIPALAIAIAGGWWQVILVVLVFVIANQIDNHLLTPYVLSRSTRLHPVTVILAVIGGFAFGGIVAAILAVPLVAFLTVLIERHYKTSRLYRDG